MGKSAQTQTKQVTDSYGDSGELLVIMAVTTFGGDAENGDWAGDGVREEEGDNGEDSDDSDDEEDDEEDEEEDGDDKSIFPGRR